MTAPPLGRPSWRGVLHQWAALLSVPIGCVLLAIAPTNRARIGVGVYALSLVTLFGMSALYHRVTWTPRVRLWLSRADHASIFLLIGGTYTPVAMLGVEGAASRQLLIAAWTTAAIGIVISLFWAEAPKAVSAALAIAVGWTAAPFLDELQRGISATALWLILAGGVAYTAGAIMYAARRPNPWPRHFGYHEVFHACTIVGAGLHLASVVLIVR